MHFIKVKITFRNLCERTSRRSFRVRCECVAIFGSQMRVSRSSHWVNAYSSG